MPSFQFIVQKSFPSQLCCNSQPTLSIRSILRFPHPSDGTWLTAGPSKPAAVSSYTGATYVTRKSCLFWWKWINGFGHSFRWMCLRLRHPLIHQVFLRHVWEREGFLNILLFLGSFSWSPEGIQETEFLWFSFFFLTVQSARC